MKIASHNTRHHQHATQSKHLYDTTALPGEQIAVEYMEGETEAFWLRHPRSAYPPFKIDRKTLVEAFISADPNASLLALYSHAFREVTRKCA